MTDFDTALAAADTSDAVWRALQDLTEELVGAKLFTIMTVDMDAMLARRAYTSDPENYPASGTKPIVANRWFDHVHGQGLTFVANTLAEIDTVFPDAPLIGRLGCGSVVNLPIWRDGQLVATVNMLHEEGYYTPERVARVEADLPAPAERAWARAASVGAGV